MLRTNNLSRPARAAALLAMCLFSWGAAEGSCAQPVALRVIFNLTDHEQRPISAAHVRLVFGAERGWQSPQAGQRFTTDATGWHTLEVMAPVEPHPIKRPTNFVDSVLARPEPADRLQVAAELDYAGRRWLYVIELHRFRSDGAMLCGGLSVFTPNARGDFVQQAKSTGTGWIMADLGGLVLTQPGYTVVESMLDAADGAGGAKRWTLTLGFRRAAEPVRR